MDRLWNEDQGAGSIERAIDTIRVSPEYVKYRKFRLSHIPPTINPGGETRIQKQSRFTTYKSTLQCECSCINVWNVVFDTSMLWEIA